jgi:hypothetical protein
MLSVELKRIIPVTGVGCCAVVPAGNVFIAGVYEMNSITAGVTINFREPMIGRFTGQRYTKF